MGSYADRHKTSPLIAVSRVLPVWVENGRLPHVSELFVTAHYMGNSQEGVLQEPLGSYVQRRLTCNDRTVIAHESRLNNESEAYPRRAGGGQAAGVTGYGRERCVSQVLAGRLMAVVSKTCEHT